jgi:putative transposase
MGRAERQDIEGGWHHVMNRGADGERIFLTRTDGEAFERLLGEGADLLGVEVHAYCLMPNHFHLLLHCPNRGLSKFMQRLGVKYTRRINERRGGDGPLFRSRFRSRLVDSEDYIAQAGRYIHRNPLDLAGVHDVVTYRWSSMRCYAGLAVPPPWLHTATLLAMCSGDYLSYIDDELAA